MSSEIDRLKTEIEKLKDEIEQLEDEIDYFKGLYYQKCSEYDSIVNITNELDFLVRNIFREVAKRDRLIAVAVLDDVKDEFTWLFSDREYRDLKEELLRGRLL